MGDPPSCRTARARGAVPTARQSGQSTSVNDPPVHAHRARSCRTGHPVRFAVIPSSTQFLLLTGLNQCAFTVSTGEFFNKIGQTRTFKDMRVMSALPPKATDRRTLN